MKKHFLILSILLSFTAQAQSMELASKLLIRVGLKKAPPKYLCVEAGYGDEVNVKLVGETNAVMMKVKEYTGSNTCYDFFTVTRGKAEFQARVYHDSVLCNNPVEGKVGPDGERAESPIRTTVTSFAQTDENNRIPQEIIFSSQPYQRNGRQVESVPFYQAFKISTDLSGYSANDRLNSYLGRIVLSCGPYVLIKKQLYTTKYLSSLHKRN